MIKSPDSQYNNLREDDQASEITLRGRSGNGSKLKLKGSIDINLLGKQLLKNK